MSFVKSQLGIVPSKLRASVDFALPRLKEVLAIAQDNTTKWHAASKI